MALTKNSVLALMVGGFLLGVVLISAIGLYSYANSLRTQSIAFETQLNAQYLSNQNNLSTYVSGFYEQLGIVKYKSEKLNSILTDYAKGRNFGTGNSPSGPAFINAVHEAVPELKGLDIADRMIDYVQSGRESYKTVQDKLLDMLRSYDRWRNDGYVQSCIIRDFIGVPSERLEARLGTTVTRGQVALDRMYVIVLAEPAADAYTTGKMNPLEVK